MLKLNDNGVYLKNGKPEKAPAPDIKAREHTMAYQILRAHDKGPGDDSLRISFDSLISHDITYVGIIQTAKASGLTEFPVPYVLTNCHNSLCAVGGTINEDDHVFGLSAAVKYGGIYVPANQAVIHQYAREMMAGCGRMILGSDSHTRYGALGTLGIGEGGPELVKQLLENTYDIPAPRVVLVWLSGKPKRGVGPHDVAIALCGAVYKNGFVKNSILEFCGPGIKDLSMDFRIGIDVMTTETACLSSIWETDERVEEYLSIHGRAEAYKELKPEDGAYYDAMIEIDLSSMEPMAALPFHPSEAYTIRELMEDGADILRETEKRASEQFGDKVSLKLTDKIRDGHIYIDQGIIAGCAGGMYENIAEAASILKGRDIGSGAFSLSIYPPSMPVNLELIKNGIMTKLTEAGAVFKPCFCGPCFGAGDVPANNALSIRHTTRNFPNREGSRPGDGQLSAVMLMDARSIAATAANHGRLTPATDIDYEPGFPASYGFDGSVYDKRVYYGFGSPKKGESLSYGPNIAEWPAIPELKKDLIMELASVIQDEVTTTDELIPSGETSSYRSNPLKLASFALSRRDPEYVPRTADIRKEAELLEEGRPSEHVMEALSLLGLIDSPPEKAAQDSKALSKELKDRLSDISMGSVIFARKPGDGSAREQAASCQRVLGGCANICYEFATKRYRSNCINWGMMPFTIDKDVEFDYKPGDLIYVPDIREHIQNGDSSIRAKVVSEHKVTEILLHIAPLTKEEKEILLLGCLMNYYAAKKNGGHDGTHQNEIPHRRA